MQYVLGVLLVVVMTPFVVDVVDVQLHVALLVQLESYVQFEPTAWQHGASPQQFGAAFAGFTQASTIIAENNPTIGFGKSKGEKMRKSGKFVYKKTTIKIVPLYSA